MRSKQTTRLLVKAKAVNSTLLTRETLMTTQRIEELLLMDILMA